MLAGFGEGWGLPRSLAISLGRALGGGMGQGLVCGAVSGAVLVLGLGPEDRNGEGRARAEALEMAREFSCRFANDHGSIICKDLLGVDVGTEEGHRQAVAQGLFQSVCPGLVGGAAAILSDLLARRQDEGK